MKKGSKLEKCWLCGKPIFWKIPDGTIGGFIPQAKIKKIAPHFLRKNKWWCEDCWRKEENHDQ